MSHAGPPSEPPQDPDQNGSEGQAGAEPYNPYPDNWESGGTRPGPSSSPPAPPNPYEQASPYQQPDPYGQAPVYGQPDPYGQQSPYAAPGQPGQPAQPGQPGAANPYAGPPSNKPTFGFGGYASWSTRVGAYLIDQLGGMVAAFPLWIGYGILIANTTTTTNTDGTTTSEYSGSIGLPVFLIVIGAITSIGFYVWNICIRQGRTGASIGKSVLAVRLVNTDMQPIGPGWSFLRSVLHIVDAIPCYLGYFWPIWDSRRQTFADKIMNTFVIQATAPAPPVYPPPTAPYQSY
jgi:uncharacterized RDD family membrane protein YckC